MAESILNALTDVKKTATFKDDLRRLNASQCLEKINGYCEWINSLNVHSVMVLASPSIDYLCLCYSLIISNKTFIPLHPSTSSELINNYLQRYPVDLFLLQPEFAANFSVNFREEKSFLYHLPEIPRQECLLPGEILFTSGTTGFPKAVHYQYDTLFDYASWCSAEFNLGSEDCFLFTSELSFAASIRSLFVPLMSGTAIRFIASDSPNKLQSIIKLLCNETITVLNMTPSLLGQLIKHLKKNLLLHTLHSIRLVLLSGEAIDVETINTWLIDINKTTVFYNLYGTTECLIPFYKKINAPLDENEGCHLGNLRTGCDYSLVFDALKGYELYLTGNVSTAYLETELNQANYVIINDRRYVKTNDFVIMRDKQLYFSGRSQRLIKRYGQLISLDQIEYVLKKGFSDLNFKTLHDGNRIVLLINGRIQDNSLLKQIKHHLQAHLPDYMHPQEFLFVKEFPLTASGKTDYYSLHKEHTSAANSLTDYFKRFSANKAFSLEIRIGDLGLESIDYLEMAEALQKITGKWLDISKINEDLPISAIESCLRDANQTTPGFGNKVRLNSIQKAVYNRELYGLDKEGVYQISFWLLKQEMDMDKLEIALAQTLTNHFILSSQLKWIDDDYYFVPAAQQTTYKLRSPLFFTDKKLLKRLKTSVFQDRLVNLFILKKRGQYYLAMAYHHIAIDGWSALLIREEIFRRYQCLPVESLNRAEEIRQLNLVNELVAASGHNIEVLRTRLLNLKFEAYNHLDAIFKGVLQKQNTCIKIEKRKMDAFAINHHIKDSTYSVVFALLLQQMVAVLAGTDKLFFYISFSNRNIPIPGIKSLITNLAIGLPVFLESSHLPLQARAAHLKDSLALYFKMTNYNLYNEIYENQIIPEYILNATQQPYLLVYTYINQLANDGYTQNYYIDWAQSSNEINYGNLKLIFLRVYDMGEEFVFTLDTQMKEGLHEVLINDLNTTLNL